jgi:hypothetical protein
MIKAPLNRRRFLIGSAGLSFSGCDRLTESEPTQRSFSLVEDLTYRAQRMLLGANRLAPNFPKLIFHLSLLRSTQEKPHDLC